VTPSQLSGEFEKLVRQAEAHCGRSLEVALVLWKPEAFPYPRNYAFCSNPRYGAEFGAWKGCCSICVAPKILQADTARVHGVLMHEIGHAVDFLCTPGHPNHGSERRADDIAQQIWGIPIKYDKDTVQSTCCGVHPRPAHLGL
jgi:hypothetical protein